MEFRILGPVTLSSNGRQFGLRSDKERIVLASLALEPGRPVALQSLVERLWQEDELPAQPEKSVYPAVSRVRRAIGDALAAEPGDAEPPRIQPHAHSYTLRLGAASVDWSRFRHLTAVAKRLVAEGNDTRAVSVLRQADALWHSEALSGLPGLWAEQVRTSMAESHLSATSTRIAAELRLGRYSETLSELPALHARHPLHQRLAGYLMIAYYGCERDAEALAVFRGTRKRLRAEEGHEPRARLSRIHDLILNGAPLEQLIALVSDGRRTTRGTHVGDTADTPRASRGVLPSHDALVGRQPDLARLLAAARASGNQGVGGVVALESISGMAGVGKTALALNAAHQLSGRFPDGPLYVNLLAHAGGQAPLSSGEALAYLLRYAGVPAEKVPADEEERAALWRTVAGRLVSVIVLDDAAGPDQVRPLLPGRSPSLLIITSRRKLNGLPGTRSVTLDVLPPNEALALFRNFAGEERSRDVDDGELAAVVELCGFLPLAIKLVAHRFSDHPSWSVATLRDRLSRPSGRLREIRDGYIEIANAFDLSYRTLEPEQQRAFRLLGLHIGDGFDPMAAAALIGLPLPQVERMVELLHQSHLLQEPAPNRFCFHDLLGEYARTLADSEDSDEVRQASQGRLIDFLLHAADRADRLVYPRRPRFDIRGVPLPEYTPSLQDAKDAKGWLRVERTNLLAAEAHARARGDTERAALLSHVLASFLDAEGRWLDTARMHRQAVHHWRRRGNRRALGLALLDLATAQANTSHYDAAQESCEGALEFARSTHDVELEAEALRMLGVVSWHGGRNQDALAYQEQALALRRHVGDDWHRGRCLDNIGISLLYLGQLDDALEHFTLAIEWLERSDDRRTLGKTLNNFGDLLNTMGKTKRAREAYERSLAIAESVGTPLDKGIAQLNLACVLSLSTDKGDSAAAESMLAECLEIFRRIGDRKNEANTLLAVGTSRHSSESFEDAESHARQALDLIRAIGAGNEHVQAQRQLGQAIAAQGRLQEGALHLEEALDLARRGSMPQEEATALQALAEVRLCEGHTDQARTLLRRAIDLLEPLDATGAAAIRDRLRRAN